MSTTTPETLPRDNDEQNETSGIRATDNDNGQQFFFYTSIQSEVENAMMIMGYGCTDYNLSFFQNRPQPNTKIADIDRTEGGEE